jgi:hypothetical protein
MRRVLEEDTAGARAIKMLLAIYTVCSTIDKRDSTYEFVSYEAGRTLVFWRRKHPRQTLCRGGGMVTAGTGQDGASGMSPVTGGRG